LVPGPPPGGPAELTDPVVRAMPTVPVPVPVVSVMPVMVLVLLVVRR
jgi:hypothetical protein